jgi:uncharacterized protein (DUF433 family)
MSKTVVMTLRLPAEVARGVERLAGRFGHKPAQLGVRLVEEGLRRRDHPHIDLRDTAAGRVAYIGGTRFAVYWVLRTMQSGVAPEEFARQYELPIERVHAALAYAKAFPDEIKSDNEQADANMKWLEEHETPVRRENRSGRGRHAKSIRKAA